MKPDWDKLMEEYDGHADILIADVDCTAAGKSLCDEQGVKGFPTIKHGDPENLEDYKGKRDYEALAEFAKTKLGPRCGPANLDLCEDSKKQQIQEYMAMPMDDLTAKVNEGVDAMAAADKELEELLKSLQSQYEAATKTKEEKMDAIKSAGLGLLKSVLSHRKKQEL
eukprot:TRINITY_DN89009_c0_g1_i1.p1 TRINITY_DN89009_c0_g1~~TRINITY_DN89009_c0_g1_i1.p1  ORF type:complete len:167 (-),score=47.06 TRINITY_DN89009_c0_g1_i1:32-532(-)